LSALALEELYAGADAAGRKKLARFERDFARIAEFRPLKWELFMLGIIISCIFN